MSKAKKKRGRMGRPPVPKGQRAIAVSISIREPELKALRAHAKKRGVGFSALMNEITTNWLKRQGRK